MSLTAGKRLGPYEIVSFIGEGGMGQVYRAQDARLDRTVAIKVLLQQVSEKPEFRQRFEREAQMIARLNHPNICVLHDVGHQDGLDYLVMEYLEGETLAQRLEKGPLPFDEALKCAIAIADALDKAHRQGVTHRDLKPSNIILSAAGPKLLDFGLAKLGSSDSGVTPMTASAVPTNAMNLTGEGAILGTLQYMSPEQLEGKGADARSDIFAFGATLYEMVTGKKAFSGKSQVSLMAAILEHDPKPVSTLQPLAPRSFERLIQICLAKDPEERFQTMREVIRELRWIVDQPSQVIEEPKTKRSSRAGWIAASVLLLVATGFAAAYFLRDTTAPPTVRFSFTPPEGSAFTGANGAPRMALSPDSKQLVFGAGLSDVGATLWSRRLDSSELRELPGTAAAQQVFWSPDSRFIVFFSNSDGNKLKRMDVSGGPVQILCNAPSLDVGGSWNRDGVILFGGNNPSGPIMRVAAEGGIPEPVTTLEPQESSHLWPRFLPDGDHFIYFSLGKKSEDSAVFVGALKSSEKKRLMQSAFTAEYAAPGYLLFVREETLMAQPFDASRLELTGEPVPVTESVAVNIGNGRVGVTASDNVVAFRENPGGLGNNQMTWFDRTGKQIETFGVQGSYGSISLSANGRQVAVDMFSGGSGARDIWVTDLARGIPSRLTSDPATDRIPFWSPNGDAVVFSSNRAGVEQLYVKPTGGFGEEKLLFASDQPVTPNDWSADGRLIFSIGGGSRDIYAILTTGDGKSIPIQTTPFDEIQGRLSPDGRWLAFVSNESGAYQVYVRSFPAAERKWQISSQGGTEPHWRGDGKELFFRTPDGSIMAVQMRLGEGSDPGLPITLFKGPYIGANLNNRSTQYAVTPDGQRFLINVPGAAQAATPITVIVNWPATLKQR